MKLVTARIKNYRSIKDETIKFQPSCLILVGINESGKSNILKALSLLKNGNFEKQDIRRAQEDEGELQEAFISFNFELEPEEISEVVNYVQSKIASRSIKTVLTDQNGKEKSLQALYSENNEGFLKVDSIKQDRRVFYYKLPSEYKLNGNFKKINEQYSGEIKINLSGEEKNLKNYNLVNLSDFPNIPEACFTKAELSNLQEIAGEKITEIIRRKLPEVIFWQYHENNLLPPSISIKDFCADPNKFTPLKYMFSFTGHNDPKDTIEKVRSDRNGFRSLLHRVAKETTKLLQTIWKENKNVKFSLEPDGDNILVSLEEQNSFDFQQRSDGVKRFLTFLLMISAPVRCGEIKNQLLLIDEPDIGLHPSGARYLKKELLEISKNNLVVYSTHSPFMIDDSNIERHIIVEKEKETTSITIATESNIVNEEVINNALGYSVFDSLKQRNIIVEGWRDKKLFQIAIKRVPSKYSEIKEELTNLGVCYGRGVKGITTVTSILEIAKRKCVILTDSDNIAKEHQNTHKTEKAFGTWKRYDEILGQEFITGEDFIKTEIVIKRINEQKTTNPRLANLAEIESWEGGVIKCYKGKLAELDIEPDGIKLIIEDLKEKIFVNLEYSHIKPDYYEMLKKLLIEFQETE